MLVIGAALGLVATLADVGAGGINCSGDASYCAEGKPDVRWEGRLFDPRGVPGASARVSLDFGSVPGDSGVRTRADALGRFCVLWSRERVVARVSTGPILGSGKPDPRFARGRALEPAAHDPDVRPPPTGPPVAAKAVLLTNNRLLDGAIGSGLFANYRDWDQGRDSPRGCHETAGPPWNRRDGALGNWRSLSALCVGLLALSVALIGLALRRRRAGAWVGPVSAFLGVAAVVAFAIVWGPVL
jgi:hypothetical protein